MLQAMLMLILPIVADHPNLGKHTSTSAPCSPCPILCMVCCLALKAALVVEYMSTVGDVEAVTVLHDVMGIMREVLE